MGIAYSEKERTFRLETRSTVYCMVLGAHNHLLHMYYGRTIGSGDLGKLFLSRSIGFSPDYYEDRLKHTASPDTAPQEYTGCNTGDYRLSTISVTDEQGSCAADFRYVSHEIRKGKYALDGLPSAHGDESESETLCVRLEDAASGLAVELLYGVFFERDVITRAARIANGGSTPLRLARAESFCLDIPFGEWDIVHFHGRHAMERLPEREALGFGIRTISSTRGASSHQHNPFVIVCERGTDEERGDCIGAMLAYSGSFRIDLEKTQTAMVRVTGGINDDAFCWELTPGASFDTPEVLLAFTPDGLGALSRIYHRFLRHNMCRGPWSTASGRRRPVLINNWEATAWNFTADKIISLAEKASSLGFDLFVLDDGWFRGRRDDFGGLGDWVIDTEKLPGGLAPLIEKINSLGMKFGIWVEPEMVNEDSDLYREHPDWALTLPGRRPAMGRCQLVLDMGREEVVRHIEKWLTELLQNHKIAYVKWDFNRDLSDVYSRALPAERQGEARHRYMLGLYSLLERLTTRFPDVLFEGCAGGGGRFDAGMLAYFPQIWCSDDTDAIERLEIQHGTSFGYPIASMGSHVSDCPNQQTGRTTPLATRATVAMSGTFGYEMDPNRLTDEECGQVRAQIDRFRRWEPLIRDGDYFRLSAPDTDCTAWQFASCDAREALLCAVVTHPRANMPGAHIALCGLSSGAVYRVDELVCDSAQRDALEGARFSGSFLMYAGLTLPVMYGDYPALQMHITRED